MNYTATTRTNYFRVEDAEKLEALLQKVSAEDAVEFFTRINPITHETYYGFGCEGIIYGMPTSEDEDCEEDYDEFVKALQELIVEGDAAIIMQTGHEGLRYVDANAVIISKKDVKFWSMDSTLIEQARELLGNADWATDLQY